MASSVASGSSTPIAVPDGLQRLMIDVRSHQLPRLLGQSPGDDASELGDEEYEVAERELHDTQARIDAQLEDWSMDAIDLGNNAREREAWARLVRQVQQDVAQLKRESQKALLEGHRLQQDRRANKRAAHWRQQNSGSREALFGDMSSTQGERDRRKDGRLADQTSDDKLMTASSDVTATLQRTVKLMSAELEKSSYSAQLLDESTVAIQQATLQYTSFSDLVASSRKLIVSMERADMVDAIILGLSMLFFACCILYILKVRIWDKGVGIIAFFGRMAGLTRTRSVADVSEKLRMAKDAAKSQSIAASVQSVQRVASEAAAAASATVASSIAAASNAAMQTSSDPIAMSKDTNPPAHAVDGHDEL